jgi:SAM-dependent methyltransferase
VNVSIFTPCHNTAWLQDAYHSIKDQDFYEWTILYNNGAQPVLFDDARVKTYIETQDTRGWVGPLKARCCEIAAGEALLELDADDMLLPGAVDAVKQAFIDPEVGFVYSNAVHCNARLEPVERYSEAYGWRYRTVGFGDSVLDEFCSFPPEPCAVSRIWYAPDHLRAFKKSVYEQAGGYNRKMRVLDDLDLICRMYLITCFHHIDQPLYLYREHDANTYKKHNVEIQDNVYHLYDRYIESLADKWAFDRGLKRVELGGRMAARVGYTTVDLREAEVLADLNGRWPFENSSIGVVRALDTFEHLKDPVHIMRELYRVLASGGYAFIQVPSTDGRGAFQDPTHRSFWNENSFYYYTDHRWNRYIDCPVRFQSLRCYTTAKNNASVCWTIAHLMKLGDSRVPGIVAI